MNSNFPNGKASLYAFLAALLLSLGWVLSMIGPLLLPILMGSILALISYPFYTKLVSWTVRPRLASLLVSLGVILLLVGPALGFAAMAVKQGLAIAEAVSLTEGFQLNQILEKLAEWGPLAEVFGTRQVEGGFEQLAGRAIDAGNTVLLSIAKSLPSGVINLILMCLACFYLLVDGKGLVHWINERLPFSEDVRSRIASAFSDTAISVVWASMAAALTQAVLVFAAFVALGIPAAFLAGGLTFIFAFVPFAGSFPVWMSGILFLILENEYPKAIVLLAAGIFITVIDNIVRPWVLKGRNEMHPLVSLISIIGGIRMFGIAGAFVGPILSAIVITLLQVWPVIGRRYGVDVGNDANLIQVPTTGRDHDAAV